MEYEFLSAESVADYIRSKPELSSRVNADMITSVQEVGDGNLNLVFIVADNLGSSVVLKQALPYVRLVGPDWPMTPFRAQKEAEALRIHGSFNQSLVPEVFLYDSDRFVIGMENLSNYRVWRGAMIEGLRHEGVASQMGEYVGELAFGTSVLGMDAEDQKRLMADSINPELCKITEDLVFTEPHNDIGRNSVLKENEKDAQEHANDVGMIRAMGEAKWKFMTSAEALIHGDLHTGSVMVAATNGIEGPSVSKAFDSEFAFYGPVGFDLGALWANYTLNAARSVALGNDDYADWALSLINETWVGFETTIRSRYNDRLDKRVWREGMLEDRLSQWKRDAWLFSAAKMSRRIVGLAKVADVEQLEPSIRIGAARGTLNLARTLVAKMGDSTSIENYVAIAHETLHRYKTV